VAPDDFIRTTERRHVDGVQALWRRLRDRDQIYLGHYEGWYAVRDEDFYSADDVRLLPDGSRVAPTGAPVEWCGSRIFYFGYRSGRMRCWRITRQILILSGLRPSAMKCSASFGAA